MLALLSAGRAAAQTEARLPAEDRVRLAEAHRLVRSFQDSIWDGWSEAPLATLLVTAEREYLAHHPQPSGDFSSLGYDSLLGSEVWVRDRVFPPSFLASFPAVGGIATIVIGQPARTGKTSTEWVVTLLHEHFHQLQYSRPGYYTGVEGLDLAGGDTTGMWMLNYPFPYDSAPVQARFGELARTLGAGVDGVCPNPERRSEETRPAWKRFRTALSPRDYRYFSFVVWQEGIARYTEIRAAEFAAGSGEPLAAFRELADFEPYSEVASRLREEVRSGLAGATLGEGRRGLFYPLGAAAGFLLDCARPGWRERYFETPFSLDALLGVDSEPSGAEAAEPRGLPDGDRRPTSSSSGRGRHGVADLPGVGLRG